LLVNLTTNHTNEEEQEKSTRDCKKTQCAEDHQRVSTMEFSPLL